MLMKGSPDAHMPKKRMTGKRWKKWKDDAVRRIVGSAIEPLGFKPVNEPFFSWGFVRVRGGCKRYYDPETDEIGQGITIGEGTKLTENGFIPTVGVSFSTDAHYSLTAEDMHQESCREHELFPEGIHGIGYEDEEGFEEAMRTVVRIIEEYGLEYLERRSVEVEEIVTRAMHSEFAEDYDKLAAAFRRAYLEGLPSRPHTPDEVLLMTEGITRALAEAESLPYGEAKPILLKTAAFLFQTSCEIAGAKPVSYTDSSRIYLEHTRSDAVSANCIDPLQSVVIAWRLRHLDVPDYTSLFLHSLAVDPDRPSFEITLDTDTVVRSVLGPALESMGFAFDEIGAIAARARSSTTVWAWTRLEEGSFLERAPKRTPPRSPAPPPDRADTPDCRGYLRFHRIHGPSAHLHLERILVALPQTAVR